LEVVMVWRKLRALFGLDKTTEAQEALMSAQYDLAEAVARDPEVKREVAELRQHREVNHLAERIKATLREA
jgi:sensor histidine kinase regulating citrate/malate metabolism